jgi:hypothetical protein
VFDVYEYLKIVFFPFSMFQVTYLNHVLEIWWFLKKIEQILGIKNLKKYLILALLIFNISFWL